MSNHPWRRASYMFSCPPGCENRKPGCQDHCETYAKDRAEWDARMAIEKQRRQVDRYVTKRIGYYKDRHTRCDHGGLIRKPNGPKI